MYGQQAQQLDVWIVGLVVGCMDSRPSSCIYGQQAQQLDVWIVGIVVAYMLSRPSCWMDGQMVGQKDQYCSQMDSQQAQILDVQLVGLLTIHTTTRSNLLSTYQAYYSYIQQNGCLIGRHVGWIVGRPSFWMDGQQTCELQICIEIATLRQHCTHTSQCFHHENQVFKRPNFLDEIIGFS